MADIVSVNESKTRGISKLLENEDNFPKQQNMEVTRICFALLGKLA